MSNPLPADDPERVLFKRDLAARYGIRRETLWKWQRAGKIPAPDVNVAGRPGWRLSTVRAYETSAA